MYFLNQKKEILPFVLNEVMYAVPPTRYLSEYFNTTHFHESAVKKLQIILFPIQDQDIKLRCLTF